MKLSKKLLEYLEKSSNYEYSGWILNDIVNQEKSIHIEHCSIKIGNLIINIRQDNYEKYYINIMDLDHSYICDLDNIGRPILTFGELENSEDLIMFLKSTSKTN